jgi:hypothetical protein
MIVKLDPAPNTPDEIEQGDWYPQWRIEELALKYSPPDAYEPDEVDEDE